MQHGHSAIDNLMALSALKQYQAGGEVDLTSQGKGLKGWLESNVSKEQIVPILEFMTGAMERGQGQQGSAFELAMAAPILGSVGRSGKALRGLRRLFSGAKGKQKLSGAVRFPESMIRVVEKGQPERMFTTVERYDEAGRKILQPFYKSSGTSTPSIKNIRAGKWMPFLGRLEEPALGGQLQKGWYVKGRKALSMGGEKVLHGDVPKFAKEFTPELQDYWLRMGSKKMKDISDVLSRMERKKMLPALKSYKDIGGRAHFAGDLEKYVAKKGYAPSTFAPQAGTDVIARDYRSVNKLLSDVFGVSPHRRLFQ